MRVFVVILMMALLPLRAGLGDVMALERSRPDAPADVRAAALHDCHEALQQHAMVDHSDHHAPPGAAADGVQAEHGCGECAVCHAAALPGTLVPSALVPAGHVPPQARVLRPLSADPVAGFKPPIA